MTERPRSAVATAALVLFFLALSAMMVFALPRNLPSGNPVLVTAGTAAAPGGSLSATPVSSPTPAASVAPQAAVGTALTLGIGAQPTTICAQEASTCPAGQGVSRVSMSAAATASPGLAYPAVQVAFVLETAPQDGAGMWGDGEIGASDTCATTSGSSGECEESNGIPFFVANAQAIANEISAANPHTQVSFALVDYFATYDDAWDDFDGAEYHVDIAQFVSAPYFGAEVRATFQQTVLGGGWYYGDNDDADNTLDTSSITALYGTIIGSGLSWSPNTHHVIVWMGSSAPQAPNYQVNNCLGWQTYASYESGASCYDATCEPAYTFSNGIQPACEGWVKPYNGNPQDSIAVLAHTAPTCADSVGGDCTIDMIDLYDCATSPTCKMWATGRGPGSGPGGYAVLGLVDKILLAGCNMAAATGGTWDGPAWFSCPNGQTGTLQEVPHGSVQNPNTQNPYLMAALRGISFGAIQVTQVAKGTGTPVFTFVPFGKIALAPQLNATAKCTRIGAVFKSCQTKPQILHDGSITYLGWNWSTNASQNTMYVGDVWQASFNVIATGPPYSTVPVDACTTSECIAAGSGRLNGIYTWATYVEGDNTTLATQSFPLAEVTVEAAVTVTTTSPPPSPPPPPPPPPTVITPSPVATPQQVGIGNTVTVSNVSLQGVAAGVIAAGFTRISLRQRPIAVFASKSGATPAGGSRFSSEGRSDNPAFGRLE